MFFFFFPKFCLDASHLRPVNDISLDDIFFYEASQGRAVKDNARTHGKGRLKNRSDSLTIFSRHEGNVELI